MYVDMLYDVVLRATLLYYPVSHGMLYCVI